MINNQKIWYIDAFASKLFEGNPAAICPLETWLSDEQMQNIAAENNLSETAFFIADGDEYKIRWFTPTVEVDLCGHATLAAAYVLFEELAYGKETISFSSKSGVLEVSRQQDLLVLDFPTQTPVPCLMPRAIHQAFGQSVLTCLKAEDYLVVLNTEADVYAANPDMDLLKTLDLRGVIITAQSENYDVVARFFAPNSGIDEDPVTGSAFTQLTPYWAQQLGKTKLIAKQVSKRGGEVHCELMGERVTIGGKAMKYLEGTIHL